MLRCVFTAVVMCVGITACGPTVYRPAPEDVQKERERLTARSQEYYRQQKERVERIGKQLLAQTINPPNIEFLVVEGDQNVNAGATFGKIMVTAGMLHFARSDDELAMVLGHELGHHTQSHIGKALASSVLATIAINAAAIAAGVGGGPYAAQSAGQLASGLIGGAVNSYNQKQELEADVVGLGYAAAAGYNPEVAADLFERMAVEVPQTLTADFTVSHPSSPERILAIRKAAEAIIAKGVYTPRPQTVATAPLPYKEESVNDEDEEAEEDAPRSSRKTRRAKPEFEDNDDSPLETKLRTLYRELRSGRISEEDYETRKQAVLRSE